MVALGIRKLSPPASSVFGWSGVCVVAMGAGAKIVCALPFMVGHDHFSAIRGVLAFHSGTVAIRTEWDVGIIRF